MLARTSPGRSDGREAESADYLKFRAKWIEQVFNDKEVKATEFRVAYAITRFLNSGSRDCFPGQMLLAECANVSARTAWEGIHNLMDRGHLQRISEGKFKSGLAARLRPVLLAQDNDEPQSKSDQKSNGHNQTDTGPPWPADYKRIFCDSYPRRQAVALGGKALDVLAQDPKRPPWDDIKKGLESISWFWEIGDEDERKLVPYPAKWVQEERWEDRPADPRRRHGQQVRP
jgi:hypothetical protein